MLRTVQGQHGVYELDLTSRRSGGTAEVYRAMAPDGRSVAIKIAFQRMGRWLEKERAALTRLQARGDGGAWMVEVRDHGATDDGRGFVVLPWYDWSLEDWLSERDPPLAARFQALEGAAAAVVRLHQSGDRLDEVVVHRDIKPGNFLIHEDSEGIQTVLADLGAVKRGRMLSRAGNTTIHTPEFAPPEQALPIETDPDPSLDVHALGVTIYWALVGDVPLAVQQRLSFYLDTSHELKQLAQRGLKRSPADEQRYQALRSAPLGELFDLERARALLSGDEERLRAELEDRLFDATPEPRALAEAICGALLPELRRALDPDPDRRRGHARKLLAGCRKGRELIEGAARPRGTWAPEDAGDDTVLIERSLIGGGGTLAPGESAVSASQEIADSFALDGPGVAPHQGGAAPVVAPREARPEPARPAVEAPPAGRRRAPIVLAALALLGVAGWFGLGALDAPDPAPTSGAALEAAGGDGEGAQSAEVPPAETSSEAPRDEAIVQTGSAPPSVSRRPSALGAGTPEPTPAEAAPEPAPSAEAPPASVDPFSDPSEGAEPADDEPPTPSASPSQPAQLRVSLGEGGACQVWLDGARVRTGCYGAFALPAGRRAVEVRTNAGVARCAWTVEVAVLDSQTWSLEITEPAGGAQWTRQQAAGGQLRARCGEDGAMRPG